MTERLKLVTSFSQLRAGDRIYDLTCDCGRFHEAFLVELTVAVRGGGGREMFGWTTSPQCVPPAPGELFTVAEEDVENHCIFLRDTGLSREQTTEKANTKELVR